MGTYKHTNQNITFTNVSNIKNRSNLFNAPKTFRIQTAMHKTDCNCTIDSLVDGH